MLRFLPACLLTNLVLIPLSLFAQSKDVSLTRFDESYNAASTRAVSNLDLLVGLSVGGLAPSSLAHIKIANPDTPKNNNYCLSMRSRDGLYSAKAGFAIQNYLDKTVLFELPTKHSEIVNKYAPQDLAALIFEQPNCQVEKAKHFVPALRTNLPHNQVQVFLNSPTSRVRAQLSLDNKPLSGVEVCVNFEGARVGYTTLCTLNLPQDYAVTKPIILAVNETNTQGQSTTSQFTLSLPVSQK